MASSYLNIVTFLLTTLTYYLTIKPNLTYEIASNGEQYKTYISNSYMYLAIYFLLVLIVQFFVNSSVISSMCGGSVSENMGAAGVYTFLPWTLIFGVLIIIITVYPGFKSAFSDVVGYFWVASSANKIITDLLVNPDLEKILNREDNDMELSDASAPSYIAEQGIEMVSGTNTAISRAEKDIATLLKKDGINVNQKVEKNINELIRELSAPYFIDNNTDEEKSAQYDAFIGNKINKFLENDAMAKNPVVRDALNKEINQWAHIYFPNDMKDNNQKGGTKEQMQEAADLIIKICGNSSILINQIVPSNFDTYWNILKPLMKEKYQDDASRQTNDIKKELFEVVVTRDNVGEAMWYIYTGVLLTAIVQLKITSRGCVSSQQTMEENYQKFKEAEKKAQEQKELSTSTTYTITN
jgi:hypothetical protein